LEQKLTYHIAGHRIDILSSDTEQMKRMLHGFAPFSAENENRSFNDLSLEFIVEELPDVQEDEPEEETALIHSFVIEEGACNLSKGAEKYYFSIEDRRKAVSDTSENKTLSLKLEMKSDSKSIKCHCASLRSLHPDNLKFALWLAFGFLAIPKQTAALHSSVIIYNNRAILFLGESGTGKSTHTKLWLEHIPGSRLLNDDSPVVRIDFDGTNQLVPFVYGSPWSGKGRCHLNERYPVAAFVRLQQHPANKITKLSKLEAFGALYPSFPPAFLKDDYFEEQICGIISNIIMTTPVYRLQCLPDSQAAELVKTTVFKGN
jgi:hypothetical protein